MKIGVGNMTQDFKRTLVHFEDGRTFGWSGDSFLGMHDNHQYIVEAQEDGKTRFIQKDQLIGGRRAFGWWTNGSRHDAQLRRS